MFSEFSEAYTARYINKNSFEYVRRYLNKELPSDWALDEWFKCNNRPMTSEQIQIILNQNLSYLASNLNEHERKCSVQFYELDAVSEHEQGELKKVLFGMIRGLFHNWCHVFLIEFDHDFNEKTIFRALNFLNSIKIEVNALVTTWYQTNSWWKRLGVTMERPFLEYPVKGNKIFIFPNMPSIINALKDFSYDVISPKDTNSKMEVTYLSEVQNQKFDESDFTNLTSIMNMIFKWCYHVDEFGVMLKSPLDDIEDEHSLSFLLDTIKKLLKGFLENKCPTLKCKCIFNEILLATKSLQMLSEYLKENFSVERLFLDMVHIFIAAIHNICRSSMPPKFVFINVAKMLNENEKLIAENFKKTLPENTLDVCLSNYNAFLTPEAEEFVEYGSPLLNESLAGMDDFFEVLDDDDKVFDLL